MELVMVNSFYNCKKLSVYKVVCGDRVNSPCSGAVAGHDGGSAIVGG